MSGNDTADFIAYWLAEGEVYSRHGDYDWMADQLPGKRILDVGCGVGFGVEAMLRRGLAVLALDQLEPCLETCRTRLAGAGDAVAFRQADVAAPSPEVRAAIASFAPDTVACWLMGAPADMTGAVGADPEAIGRAVAYYRERVHRQVAELAATLPSVRWLHFVDRTAIAWQAKDIGRDTLVRYHGNKTLAGLPFAADRRNALYRRLETAAADFRRLHPAMKNVTPTLASLIAERKN